MTKRLTPYQGLFLPGRHRPVETCAECRQPWPCTDEQNRKAAQQRAREAVARAVDAAVRAFQPPKEPKL